MTQTKDLDPESRWPHDVLFLPICIFFMKVLMRWRLIDAFETH